MMEDFLIPESILASKDQELKRLINSSDTAYAVNSDDERYGTAFRRYLLFSRWPALLENDMGTLTLQTMLYNQYYWMLKFSKLYMLCQGYDAGMEQQVFGILEKAECEVDWSIIEQIDRVVGQEIG
jgi:hypothetical protein